MSLWFKFAQFRSFSTVSTNLRSTILFGKKDQVYGNEEGHDVKNEVRKEKWIKKRQNRPRSMKWRMQNGFEARQDSLLDRMSNWSDPDSQIPGAPTERQVALKKRNLELAQDVFDAAMLVQKAKSFK